MQELQFNLTLDETNLILEALGEMPFVRVHQLIAKIQQQAHAQLQATQNTTSVDDVLSVTDSATFGSSVTGSNLIVNGETNLKGKLSVTDNATFTGKVGIGTTEPTEKLEVNGKIKASALEVGGVKATAITAYQSDGKYSCMARFESKNPEPPYINLNHNRTGGKTLRYGYIQGGDFGSSKELRFVAENGANFTFLNSNVGIGTTTPEVKLDVAGVIRARSYKTTIYSAGGLNATAQSLSNTNNTYTDFPNLTQTFTLVEAAPIIAYYKIAMRGNDSHLVSVLVVDGTPVSRSIVGNTLYWGISDLWIGNLSAGEHTIKVQYRTPAGGASNPAGNDWENRVLRVIVLGA